MSLGHVYIFSNLASTDFPVGSPYPLSIKDVGNRELHSIIRGLDGGVLVFTIH